jgi:small conductance mechanosensitive channel
MQAGAPNALDSATARIEKFKDDLMSYAEKYGLKILGALLILTVGWIVVRWMTGAVRSWLDKQQLEPPVKSLITRVVRLLLMIGVLLAALDTAGFPTLTLITGIGVAGVGVGLALQGVLSNLVAGLTIIFTKPYRVGEYINIANVHGQVQHIEMFSTVLLHNDLSRVVIPNRKIVGEILHNYGKIRQLKLNVAVAYGTDLDAAFRLIREILAANDRVLKDPAPAIGIAALTDSSITIAVNPWTTLTDFGPAQVELYQAILNHFRAQKIEIPLPQREVRLLNQPE